MRFSIIVPVYKVEKYLPACIDSILGQNYRGYELILVDDGSPDRCPHICDEYGKKDSRVKVIHKENGGLSSARNAGLEIATGEYIVYLDSDDFFLNENSLSQIDEKAVSGPDIIMYKTAASDENGKEISYPHMDFSFNQEKCSIEEMVAITVRGEEFQTSAWSKAVRRNLLVEYDISFEEGLLGEDIDWYLNVIRHAKTYAIVDDYLYVYRNRDGSITKTVGIRNLTDLLWILDKWTKIIVGGGDNSYMDQSLRHYLGKTYTSVLIVYSMIKKGRNEYKQRVKEYSYLLNFDNYPRTQTIRKFYRLFGFEGTILALQMLLRIRK